MATGSALDKWLMFLHVLAAMAWIGGLLVVSVLGARIRRTGNRDALAGFIRSLRVVGPAVFAPALLVVLGAGIWLVARSDEWNFGQAWIVLALALLGAAVLVGAAFQSRSAIQAQRAVEAGDLDEADRQLGRWTWGMWLILLLLVFATWDMAFKPGT
jgi:uncharacterized membrane protein